MFCGVAPLTRISFDKADHLREFLFTVIESLPNGILFADRDGHLQAVNQKACSLLGLTGRSFLHRSCWEIMRQNLRISPEELSQLKVPAGQIVCEVTGNGQDEGKRCISISRNELKSPFLHITGFFLSFDDVTYPAMVATQMDRQKRLAAMQEMAVSMTQELKNPLGSLELYASLLKRELSDDPDNERVAEQMVRAVHSMNHLLDNYATFSSLPGPRLAPVNIRHWLEQACGHLQLLDTDKEMAFTFKYNHAVEEIIGDAELLRQLALNIGLNCIESMENGGELVVKTRVLSSSGVHPGFLEVKFIDQGEGIAEENLKKIFDPFFTTRNRAKGLGLAIVHHIVEAHHGFVKVESRPGQGSTFTVLLPCEVG